MTKRLPKFIKPSHLSASLAMLLSAGSVLSQTTFDYTGSIQTYTVPAGVTNINISASGAQGGGEGAGGGMGATMTGDFVVTPGEVLYIVVGQQGQLQIGGNYQNSSGGGGGSFVYNASNTLLVAAGGGGGKCNYTGSVPLHSDAHGKVTADGGNDSSNGYTGGTSGNGGNSGLWGGTPCAGGGTGWLSPGGGPYGGLGLAGSWTGGVPYCTGGGGGCGGYGGFGGGGGGGNLYGGGGGGGGYSGGAGGTDPTHGGGGGSYNAGTNQVNTGGVKTGNGQVIITVLCQSLNATASATSICAGESVTFTASSNNGGNITWDSGVTDNVPFTFNTPGNYTITALSDHPDDCAFTADVEVKEAPDYSLSTSDDFGNDDGGVYVTINSGIFPFTFDWDNDGTGDNDDTQNITNLPGGTYTLIFTHGNGCSSTQTATVNSQAGIEDLNQSIAVYPIPATDLLTVKLDGSFVYNITDLAGKIISSGNGTNTVQIPVHELSTGTYLLVVYLGESQRIVQFVKQ